MLAKIARAKQYKESVQTGDGAPDLPPAPAAVPQPSAAADVSGKVETAVQPSAQATLPSSDGDASISQANPPTVSVDCTPSGSNAPQLSD